MNNLLDEALDLMRISRIKNTKAIPAAKSMGFSTKQLERWDEVYALIINILEDKKAGE